LQPTTAALAAPRAVTAPAPSKARLEIRLRQKRFQYIDSGID
jgi:hypothetical protein